jgi:hypothetical protein
MYGADGTVVGSPRLRRLIVVGGRHSIADALMWAVIVEEACVLANHAAQAVEPEQDKVVEAFPADAAHPSFGVRVCLRRQMHRMGTVRHEGFRLFIRSILFMTAGFCW